MEKCQLMKRERERSIVSQSWRRAYHLSKGDCRFYQEQRRGRLTQKTLLTLGWVSLCTALTGVKWRLAEEEALVFFTTLEGFFREEGIVLARGVLGVLGIMRGNALNMRTQEKTYGGRNNRKSREMIKCNKNKPLTRFSASLSVLGWAAEETDLCQNNWTSSLHHNYHMY